jgi:hypothetical protein
MTTIVTPEIKQDHPESQEWPILGPDLPDATREDRADAFDPTQGRKLGSDPYDDPTQGRKLGSDPYDDPTRARSREREREREREDTCSTTSPRFFTHTGAGAFWSR